MTTTSSNGWYRITEGSDLEQGDLLERVPVFLPKAYPENPVVSVEEAAGIRIAYYDLVVITASCELAQEKTNSVLLCPHWDILAVAKNDKYFARKEAPGEIDKGRRPRYCLLAPCDLPERSMGLRLIDFSQALSLPFPYITQTAMRAGLRVRTNSPYREHVAQSFGAYHTRVGLPLRASDC